MAVTRSRWFILLHIFLKANVVFGGLIFFVPHVAKAQDEVAVAQEAIEIIVATDSITIGTDFAGADLYIAGVVENADPLNFRQGGYHVIVTLEGDRRKMVMREKKRRLGVWINADAATFYNVPLYYALVSTGELHDISAPELLRDLGIGLNNMPLHSDSKQSSREEHFRGELIRIKTAQNLYRENIGAITFGRASLFRAHFQLPANLPAGNYRINAYLFKEGAYLNHASTQIDITRAQLTYSIFYAAHSYRVLYGLAAVVMAILVGFVGRLVFRRD